MGTLTAIRVMLSKEEVKQGDIGDATAMIAGNPRPSASAPAAVASRGPSDACRTLGRTPPTPLPAIAHPEGSAPPSAVDRPCRHTATAIILGHKHTTSARS